jgi:hypothetical protein
VFSEPKWYKSFLTWTISPSTNDVISYRNSDDVFLTYATLALISSHYGRVFKVIVCKAADEIRITTILNPSERRK